MRVGLLLSQNAPTAGGGYTFQEEIFRALLSMAHESHHSFVVFCHPDYAQRLSKPPGNVEIVPLAGEPPAGGWVERRLLRRGRRGAPSIELQARQQNVEFMWFAGAPGEVLDIPYMAVVWDLEHRLQPWFPEFSANSQWQHRENVYGTVLRRAATVIVGTRVGKSEVERFYQVPPDRIAMLPHPTPSFALEAAVQEANLPEKYGIAGKFIFYPAQFWSHKNHVNLLLAMSVLRDRLKEDVQLVLVGSDQGNRGHVESWIDKLGLRDRTRVFGFIPQTDMIDLYRHALALTYVSFCGPENLPPLEAFALSCPVIAADVAGAREQLGEAALFVDPSKPDEIAEAVARVAIASDLRNQLVEKGRVRALRFTPRDFVQGVFSVLDRFEPVRRSWSN